jgi:dihydrofolate reductase
LDGFVGRIYVTLVEADIEGDAWFPKLDASWRPVKDEPRPADEKNIYAVRFQVYEKHP